MSKPFLIFLSALLFSFNGRSHVVDRTPEPQFSFATEDNQSNIQKWQVHLLFSILDQAFGEHFQNQGKSWTSAFDWSNPYLGAGSQFDGENFTVMLWGGFVRARALNFAGLAAVLCHELGHKLGGEPHQRFPDSDPDWSSAEGQSDHFAATVCLPKVYQALKTTWPEAFAGFQLESFSVSLCSSAVDLNQCRWVAQAGVDLVEFIQLYFDRESALAKPEVWAQEIPPETLHTAYPSSQCRMDIFKAGAKNPQSKRLRCWYQ